MQERSLGTLDRGGKDLAGCEIFRPAREFGSYAMLEAAWSRPSHDLYTASQSIAGRRVHVKAERLRLPVCIRGEATDWESIDFHRGVGRKD